MPEWYGFTDCFLSTLQLWMSAAAACVLVPHRTLPHAFFQEPAVKNSEVLLGISTPVPEIAMKGKPSLYDAKKHRNPEIHRAKFRFGSIKISQRI
jgi:hypothetical protein